MATTTASQSSTIDIIGWDDIKSRPIYRHVAVPADTKKKKKKRTVKINASSSDSNITSSSSLDGASSRTVGLKQDNAKRRGSRKARTISLSPPNDNTSNDKNKTVRWGDNPLLLGTNKQILASSNPSNEVGSIHDAKEDETIKNACENIISISSITSTIIFEMLCVGCT